MFESLMITWLKVEIGTLDIEDVPDIDPCTDLKKSDIVKYYTLAATIQLQRDNKFKSKQLI